MDIDICVGKQVKLATLVAGDVFLWDTRYYLVVTNTTGGLEYVNLSTCKITQFIVDYADVSIVKNTKFTGDI